MEKAPPLHVLDREDVWQTFLGQIRVGKTFGTACKAVHCAPRAVREYLRTRPERAAEYAEGESEALDRVEEALYSMATSGRELKATLAWLERRDATRWAPGAPAAAGGLVLNPADLKALAAQGEVTVVEEDGVAERASGGVAPTDVVPVQVGGDHPGVSE